MGAVGKSLLLFIRQAAGKFVYLGAGSLLRSAVRRSREKGEENEEVSEERKEADSKSNFIPSPLVFFTLSPHRDVSHDVYQTLSCIFPSISSRMQTNNTG